LNLWVVEICERKASRYNSTDLTIEEVIDRGTVTINERR
jgi:hypothetical protein